MAMLFASLGRAGLFGAIAASAPAFTWAAELSWQLHGGSAAHCSTCQPVISQRLQLAEGRLDSLEALEKAARARDNAEQEARRAIAEAEARRKAAEDARRRAEAEEARRQQAEADIRRRAEEDAARNRHDREAEARKAEELARRQLEEAEAVRKAKEAAQRAAAEDTRKRSEPSGEKEAATPSAGEPGSRQPRQAPKVRETATQQSEECRRSLATTSRAGSIYFGLDDASMAPKAFTMLDQIAVAAKACSGLMISIQGHTDDIGPESYNLALSERRASAVVTYLRTHGVAARQLRVHSYGKTRPLASNATAAGRAQNRRIDFTVTETQ